MQSTIGLDIAKSVFQVHGVDVAGQVVVRRPVEASPRSRVFPEVATLSGWDRGLLIIALLVARAAGIGAYGLMPPAVHRSKDRRRFMPWWSVTTLEAENGFLIDSLLRVESESEAGHG
jgi:hypothetical protein